MILLITSFKHNTLSISRTYITFISLVIIFTNCRPHTSSNQPDTSNPSLTTPVTEVEAQLNEIMTIWPGTYNNDQQIANVLDQGKNVWRIDDTGENGYLQIQSHYIKLDKPKIGSNVLYVEEYRDHVPTETYRQRIYTLSIDSTDMIKVKMWPFKNKTKYIGSWKDLTLLDDLTIDSISAFPDICDLHVSKIGSEYHMVMNGRDCAFGDKVFNYQVKLSKDMFSYRDKITQKSDDKIISSAAEFAYHNLNRIEINH